MYIRKKNYRDFFIRPKDNGNGYDDTLYTTTIDISNTGDSDSKKYRHLFSTCFSHHVEPDVFLNRKEDKKLILLKAKKYQNRFFEEDNLSAYFISNIYEPPNFLNHHLPKIKKKKAIDNKQYFDYKTFLDDVSQPAWNPKNELSEKLGSNVVRFLIGDVGEGKSTLTTYLYRDLWKNFKKYDKEVDIIPVYVDVDFKYEDTEQEEPRDPKEYFFEKLYKQMLKTAKKHIPRHVDKLNFENFNSECNTQDYAMDEIINLTKFLAHRKCRFVIIIDNLDRYHYFHARYAFFENGNKILQKSITNLTWLINRLQPATDNDLGNAGLSVLFVMRKYVYDYIYGVGDHDTAKNPAIAAYEMIHVPFYTILTTRARLLMSALKIIKGKEHNEEKFLELIDRLKDIDDDSMLKQIVKLGHHGNRSLVDFISTLGIDIRDDIHFERFITKQVHTSLMLYISNHFYRYAQRQNHFPNLFLNDCVISYFGLSHQISMKNAHASHQHTYWLKYFILKFITKNKDGVTIRRILDEFLEFYPEEHLIRHVVGSLCTANEFRCCEIPLQKNQNPDGLPIQATVRGQKLMSMDVVKLKNSKEVNLEFCFDYEYLACVIDDDWMSYPRKWINRVYNPNLTHENLLMSSEAGSKEYREIALEDIRDRANNFLNFIILLKESLMHEMASKEGLKEFLSEYDLIPPFDDIFNANIQTIKAILRSLGHAGQVSFDRLEKEFESDSTLRIFYHDFKSAGSPNVGLA